MGFKGGFALIAYFVKSSGNNKYLKKFYCL